MPSAFAYSLSTLGALVSSSHGAGTALVTGATGHTGSLIYKALQNDPNVGEVRAFVRNQTKAREYLGCTACDESEGIYVGEVSDTSALAKAMDGVDMLANAVGASYFATADECKQVEFDGVRNQVTAFLSKGGVAGKRIMMLSTMGTTMPPKPDSNMQFFYKLNAEAFLESSGASYAIVKPCPLDDTSGGQVELMVGHDDAETWFADGFRKISREDVANVATAALTQPPADVVHFDLCGKLPGSGPPKTPKELLEDALRPWQKSSTVV